MTVKYFIIPIAFAVALAAGAAPASAQRASGGHMGGGHMGGGVHAGGGYSAGSHSGAVHSQVGPVRGGAEARVHGGVVGGPFVHMRVIRPFRGPFFDFRPRFDLGFGLFVGYPVAYPWDYLAPYPYGYPYYVDPYGAPLAYDDPDDSGTASTPSAEQRNYGGISFDIAPGDAAVFVDGANVGMAQTFSPSSAPLTLAPGPHHVVVEKPGYQSMEFDANVTQGQVIPYKGAMRPA
jgi:hypothetical protein